MFENIDKNKLCKHYDNFVQDHTDAVIHTAL